MREWESTEWTYWTDCTKVPCPHISVFRSDANFVKFATDLFNASQADGRERGAYLFNGPNGTIRVGEVIVGEIGYVYMGNPPPDAIGKIHTHPDQRVSSDFTLPGGPLNGHDIQSVRNADIYGIVVNRRYIYLVHWQDRGGEYSYPKP
jgi:hypothetical protein